jgi:hypothetical protein
MKVVRRGLIAAGAALLLPNQGDCRKFWGQTANAIGG